MRSHGFFHEIGATQRGQRHVLQKPGRQSCFLVARRPAASVCHVASLHTDGARKTPSWLQTTCMTSVRPTDGPRAHGTTQHGIYTASMGLPPDGGVPPHLLRASHHKDQCTDGFIELPASPLVCFTNCSVAGLCDISYRGHSSRSWCADEEALLQIK